MIKRFFLGLVTCLFSSLCYAESTDSVHMGSCGFTGAELTYAFECDQPTGSSKGIKKEAAKQLLSMAWGWVTGDKPKAASLGYAGHKVQSLNDGQKFDPRFRIKARRDNLYLTVAYDF